MRYLLIGLMGDAINSLSVVKENYEKNKEKAIIYLGGNFRYDSERTFNDTYQLISSQPYISLYKIHEGEEYDCHLGKWRESDLLYKANHMILYGSTFNVDWGKTPWLMLPVDEKYKDIVFISTNPYRFGHDSNWRGILERFPQAIFLSQDSGYFDDFCNQMKLRGLLDIPCLFLDSLWEVAVAIASCKLLITGYSSPLTIRMACHGAVLICPSMYLAERAMNNGLNMYPEIYYNIDEIPL